MKRTTTLLISLLVIGVLLEGCKPKKPDPLTIVNEYFSAIEKSDFKKAYSYLCDRSIVAISEKGEEMRFQARPNPRYYEELMKNAPLITVTGIKRMPDLSVEGEIETFQVNARTKERGRNLERDAGTFLIYLGHNSEGQWSVLLPQPNVQSPSLLQADTLTTQIP